MNDLLIFLNQHVSERSFTTDEITPEQEELILNTAMRSPTSSNLHTYSIIAIRDKNKKATLSELSGNQMHIKTCPLFLVFVADLYRLYTIAKKKDYNFNGDTFESTLIATVDATLIASRALLAAQALGLGGVMVGGIRNNIEEVSRLLKLPKFCFPVMGMSLGYPAKKSKIKPRLPIETVAFKEEYDSSKFDSGIADYDSTIKELGYLSGREVDPDKYEDFEGDYSWSEHSARRMASTKRSAMRPELLSFLNSVGLAKR